VKTARAGWKRASGRCPAFDPADALGSCAMNLTTETQDGRTVAAIGGRLDSSNAGAFEQALLPLIGAELGALIVDLTGLDYISSAGLRVLLLAGKTSKASGVGFALCGLKPHVREVFDLSGFSQILNIHADRAAALGA
jgi:anti-sigma B factor antagonist